MILPASLWLRSRARLFRDRLRHDDAARARREFRGALDAGAPPLERLAACPGCGTRRRPWLLATVERMAVPHRTVLCRDCGLCYASPRMTRAALDAFYRDLYWRMPDGVAAWGDERPRFARGESILAATRERIPAGALVVEVGCGPGYNLVPFQRAGFRAVGFEPDARCAASARERFALDVRAGGADELVASGLRADLLVVAHVIEHLPDPRQFLAGARGVLAPGGVLLVEVPGLRNLDHPSYGGDLLSYLQVAHLYNFTQRTLTRLVEAAGFEVLAADESARVLARAAGSPSAEPRWSRGAENAGDLRAYLGAKERAHVARLPRRVWHALAGRK